MRLREYGLSLLGRRRIGPNPVPPAVAAGPVREGRVTPAADVRGVLWPLQPLYVGVAPVAGPARVVVRTPPLAAALVRRGLALRSPTGGCCGCPARWTTPWSSMCRRRAEGVRSC